MPSAVFVVYGQRVVKSTEGRKTRFPRRNLVTIRRILIAAIEKGYSPEEVAKIVDCGRSTVYGRISAYRNRRDALLQVKVSSRRPPLLTKAQMNQLRKSIVGKDPGPLRFEFALWTCAIVRDLIFERYKVQMTLQGVGNVLHRLGLSAQRLLLRA